jgi:tetratricopeptide (TPR) repeat protein
VATEAEAGLEVGMKREDVINRFGMYDWSAYDHQIVCYEGQVRKGVKLHTGEILSAAVLGTAVAVMTRGYGQIDTDSYDFSDDVYVFRRVLISFNRNGELERIRLHTDIKGDPVQSRKVHLEDFAAEAALPSVSLEEGSDRIKLASAPIPWGQSNQVDVLNRETMVLYRMGYYSRAAIVARKALLLLEQDEHSDGRELARCMNSMGLIYRAQGDPLKAELFFRESVTVFEKTFGPDDLELATSLENLAALYKATDRTEEAIELERRAIQARAANNRYRLDH